MTTAAQPTFGNQVWIAPHGETLVKVAELLTFGAPKPARSMMDATSHDSPGGAEEVIPEGTFNPGTVNGQQHYIAGSATDLAFRSAMLEATFVDVKIVMKGADGVPYNQTFSGYVTSYGPDDQPVKGKQAASWALQISGEVEQEAA